MLALEIVTVDAYDRKLRDNDVVIKVKEYYQAGVPLYVIIDEDGLNGPRRLLGYQRGPRKFAAVPLDELMQSCGWNRWACCWDWAIGPTGLFVSIPRRSEEIVDYGEMAQAAPRAKMKLAGPPGRPGGCSSTHPGSWKPRRDAAARMAAGG